MTDTNLGSNTLDARLRRDAAARRARPTPDLTARVKIACEQAPRAPAGPVGRATGPTRSRVPRVAAAAAVLLLLGGGTALSLGLFEPGGDAEPGFPSEPGLVADGTWTDVGPFDPPGEPPTAAETREHRAAIAHLLRGDGEPPMAWRHLLETDPGPLVHANVDQPLLAEARGLGRDATVAASFFADRLGAPLRALQSLLAVP